jgi:splicing factor 3A subunit 1
MIAKQEQNNPKFSFLRHDDPYRAYFDQQVNQIAQQLAAGTYEGEEAQVLPVKEPGIVMNIPIQQSKNFSLQARRELKPPPPQQFVLPHPKIPTVDYEIIKLTAQFVARNGQKFLLSLTERETDNPQFDFLKPNHTHFAYFTSLVDAYTKIIMPKQVNLAVYL